MTFFLHIYVNAELLIANKYTFICNMHYVIIMSVLLTLNTKIVIKCKKMLFKLGNLSHSPFWPPSYTAIINHRADNHMYIHQITFGPNLIGFSFVNGISAWLENLFGLIDGVIHVPLPTQSLIEVDARVFHLLWAS